MRKLAVAAVLALFLGLLGAAPTQAADGTGEPTITSPSEGATVPAGWTGPLVVDFTSAPPGDYHMLINCPGIYRDFVVTVYPTTTTRSFTLAPLPSGSCRATATNWTQQGDVHFTVALPPLTTPTLSLNRTVFYPRVVDGYLDTVTLTTKTNRRSYLTAEVLNSSGAVVANSHLFASQATTWPWPFDGRGSNGALLPPGNYQFRVTAKADGVTRVVRSPVFTLATKRVWERKYLSKTGEHGFISGTAGCYYGINRTFHFTVIGCEGGKYARMTYKFKPPTSARNFTYAVKGEWGPDDRSGQGSLSKVGVRPNATDYLVRVTVTKWRQYVIYRATIGFDWLHTY